MTKKNEKKKITENFKKQEKIIWKQKYINSDLISQVECV
jgi:hypothetical protein